MNDSITFLFATKKFRACTSGDVEPVVSRIYLPRFGLALKFPLKVKPGQGILPGLERFVFVRAKPLKTMTF